VLCSVLFTLATMTVVYGGISKGIERANRWMMPMLVGILLLLLWSALRLPGAGQALSFIFVPRFDALRWHAVLEALGHAFFTLSLGMGAMITYGSYMRRGESIPRAALFVVALDTLISVVSTMIMFSVIFSVAGLQEQISRSSVGMLFITLPEQFYTVLPLGLLLAPLFYVLVVFAALTSTISLLEVIVSYFIDERGLSRRSATTLCGTATLMLTLLCCLSLGAWGPVSGLSVFSGKQGLLSNLDHLAANWMLPLGGFLITLIAGWIVPREVSEAELAGGGSPAWFRYGVWRFTIRYLAPIAVAAIFLAVVLFGEDFS
jgi:NSS family neurotransmitter:Na+ symporter